MDDSTTIILIYSLASIFFSFASSIARAAGSRDWQCAFTMARWTFFILTFVRFLKLYFKGDFNYG